jgi:hypothetical protein
MADRKKEVKIRATKQETFDVLKAAAPSLFGTKVFADVTFFGEDPEDASKLILEFTEETDP